jgi:hypothetical protein
MKTFAILFFSLLFCVPVSAQIFKRCPRCNPAPLPTHMKQVPHIIETGNAIESSADLIITPLSEAIDIFEPKQDKQEKIEVKKVSLGDSLKIISEAAVKITVNNSCGSGSIVGRNESGQAIILTNAHVAGTRKGRTVNVQRWNDDGTTETGTASIIAAGYKRGASLDFALLKCNVGFADKIKTVPVAQRYPDKSKMITTTGCPRCEWPSMQVIKLEQDQGQILSWLPEAISGRSGSALMEQSTTGPRVVGLLTWAGGGKGLGQPTPLILDALSGRVPKSLQTLPDDVKEVAYRIQENENVIENITENENDETKKGKIRDNIKKRKEDREENKRDRGPGPIRRLFDFIRRVIVTVVLCAASFAGGYFYHRFKTKAVAE